MGLQPNMQARLFESSFLTVMYEGTMAFEKSLLPFFRGQIYIDNYFKLNDARLLKTG